MPGPEQEDRWAVRDTAARWRAADAAKPRKRPSRGCLDISGWICRPVSGVVLVCILFSAVAGVAGSMFLQTLIDDYIAPLLLEAAPVFSGLARALLQMALIYLVGIASTFLYNWMMVSISQGILKKVRDEMFARMQKLPIRYYFDTHTHGDLMSHFTNDTDTLQQMLSQSIPQMFSSLVTIIAVFIAMLVTNEWLTLFVLVGIAVMLVVVRKIGGQSARFFLEQQTSLGKVNGYIEEMINGQKVVKVFCHEDKCKEQFDELNNELRENAKNANTFANILMPIMMNIGNLLYVLVAVVGARWRCPAQSATASPSASSLADQVVYPAGYADLAAVQLAGLS